jgi:metal-dependent hydrolase (beta-lactamase superfamily II)
MFGPNNQNIKITAIYNNTAFRKEFKLIGFCALVEVEKTSKILFDTGGKEKFRDKS